MNLKKKARKAMNRLVPEMYGEEFRSKKGLFNLRCGQMRCGNKFGHNSGWYNCFGEKIGWGDLDKKDIVAVRDGLNEGEIFITLGEHDSFWEFVEEVGVIGSMCKVNAKEKHPELDHVIEKSRYIITQRKVYQHDDFHADEGEKDQYGVKVEYIDYYKAKEIITGFYKKNGEKK